MCCFASVFRQWVDGFLRNASFHSTSPTQKYRRTDLQSLQKPFSGYVYNVYSFTKKRSSYSKCLRALREYIVFPMTHRHQLPIWRMHRHDHIQE